MWCEAGRGRVEGWGRGRTCTISFRTIATYFVSFTLFVCFSTHCTAQSVYVQGVAIEIDVNTNME